MINKFFFSTIRQKDSPIIEFDADYIMLKYVFFDGRDLDTRTQMLDPELMTNYLGWARLSRFPASDPILLDWGGDNTGSGNPDGSTAETVLINMINFDTLYPSENEIEIDCRAFWFGTVGVLPVTIEATLWKGGTIIKGTPAFQFSNPTADDTANLDSFSKVITLSTASSASNGERVAIFKYNRLTNIGIFT